MTRYRKKFHRIARRLTNLELQRGDSDYAFTMEDVLEDLQESRGSKFLLGSYSKEGLMLVFRKFGVTKELKKMGFEDLIISIDTRDQYRQTLRLYFDRRDSRHMLGEIVLHKAKFTAKQHQHTFLPKVVYPLEMIHIEWLVLQNPQRDFSQNCPPLPGQNHPGLGIGTQVLEMLYLMAKHQHTQGLLIIPHYYHTAVIFSCEFRFINPVYQALINRLEHDLREYSLPIRAWAVECGAVFHQQKDDWFEWNPEEQILATNKELDYYLHSEEYQQKVTDAEASFSFILDKEMLLQKLPSDIELELLNDSESQKIT